MHHYPHHISDFKSATWHLTLVERALYRELLDLYYDTERPLMADEAKLARRVKAETDEHKAALHSVLDEFFVLTDEGWFNDRCAREIATYQQRLEQQSRAGKASAAKRNTKRSTPKGGGGVPPAPAPVAGDVGDARSTGVEHTLNERATNQNQNQNHKRKETSSPKGDDDLVVADSALVPKSEPVWAEVFGNEFGVEVDGYNMNARKKFWPLASGWIASGVSVGQMRVAVQRARAEATECIAYLPAYVDRVLASLSAPPPESRAEAAARTRMQQAAPLAAAQAPSAPGVCGDGYSYFQNAAQSKMLEVV